jgi:predicted phosphodiesterase
MSFEGEVISDTHLNMWKYNTEQINEIYTKKSPNLILAGDIGDPDEITLYNALDIARHHYERVIYIPGNHEFYKRTPGSKKSSASVIAWFKKLDDQWSNFHFFYRRTEVYDGVRIIGATGWSSSPKGTEWANSISDEGRKDREFIEQNLSRSMEPVLVVTHYPSTLEVLQESFRNKITQYDYAQNLEYMFRPPLHTWIFGHVHQAHDFKMPYSSSLGGSGSVRILCNPYGYPNEKIASYKTKLFTVQPRAASEGSLHDMIYQKR